MSNSRRGRRNLRAGPDPMRRWPAYTPQAAAKLRESTGAAVADPPTPTPTVEVSNRAWSNYTQGDYDIDQWRRACLLDTGDGDEDSKQRYKLPVREPDGTLNRNGVHAAAGGRGIHAVEGISDELRRATARKLVRLYRNELGEDPPERLLTLAGMDESDDGRQATEIAETTPVAIREAPSGAPLTVDLQIIEAGWNRPGSRYYPPDVLARDMPKVYPAGTHMYLDHPTVTEEAELPERSVTRLAAVLVADPYTTDGGQTMRARARVFAPHREFLSEAWRDIGVSINGDGEGTLGQREGRHGLVIEALTHGRSIDFVTKAGAGGRVLQLLESAGRVREARNVGAWLESRLHLALTQLGDEMYGDGRLTRDERITLSQAIGEALQAWTSRVETDAAQLFERDLFDEPTPTPAEMREATAEEIRSRLHDAVRALTGEDDFAYVEDFDPDRQIVWWVHGRLDSSTMWQQSYTLTGQDGAELGDRIEVVRRVTYEPVAESSAAPAEPPASPPAGGIPPAATPSEGGESLMPEGAQNPGTTPAPAGTQGGLSPEARAEVAEAQLREAQSRITTLETQVATLTTERDTSRTELGRLRVTEAARHVATTTLAESDLPEPARQRVIERVTADVPTTEAGAVDTTGLTSRINEAVQAEQTYIASLREAAGEGRPSGLGSNPSPGAVDLEKVQSSLAESYRARGLSEEAAKLAAAGRSF